jgi:hypothetical protein
VVAIEETDSSSNRALNLYQLSTSSTTTLDNPFYLSSSNNGGIFGQSYKYMLAGDDKTYFYFLTKNGQDCNIYKVVVATSAISLMRTFSSIPDTS